MSGMSDGLEDYTLGKDYGENKAGTVILVDPDRKRWLNENGYRVSITAQREPMSEIPAPPLISEVEPVTTVHRRLTRPSKEGL